LWVCCLTLRQVVYIEMVVQGLQPLIEPPKLDSSTQLRTADLVVIDRDVHALIVDLEILIDLVKVNCVVIAYLLMILIVVVVVVVVLQNLGPDFQKIIRFIT